MQLALGQHAGAAGRDAQQSSVARLVDREERVEDRGHQDRAAVVRLRSSLVESSDRARRLPLAVAGRPDRSRRAAPPTLPIACAELLRELAEEVLAAARSPRVSAIWSRSTRER